MNDALQPLIAALGHGERLTARPGRVLLDRLSGTEALEVAWGPAAHDAALEALSDGPVELEDGIAARAVQGTVVVLRSADPNRRLADLSSDGALSAIAARTLEGAVEIGRNVLVAGGWSETYAVMAAITGGGRRPGAVLDALAPTPPSWVRVGEPADIAALNPDRLCLWRTPPPEVSAFAMIARSVVAWIGAGRLDRALMRYEVALEREDPQVSAQMQVLAGLDLVVTVRRSSEGPRIREIAELVMTGEGYRPRLLFAIGAPPMQGTLVPVELPSFIHELRISGQGALAEELEAAVGESSPPRPEPRAAAPAPAATPADVQARAELGMSVLSRPLNSGELEDLREAPPPGWELDQLGDDDLPESDHQEGSADDAALAATYGLAPPPRPKGVAGESFDEILKKMRDGELGEPDE